VKLTDSVCPFFCFSWKSLPFLLSAGVLLWCKGGARTLMSDLQKGGKNWRERDKVSASSGALFREKGKKILVKASKPAVDP